MSTPEDAEMANPTLEEINVSLPPFGQYSGAQWGSSLGECGPTIGGGHKALNCLLATRSSLDARQRRQISDFGMALHQIESETTQAVKEARALCAHTIQDMETCQMTLISEAEVWHATCLKGIKDKCSLALAEAENCCSRTIREAESNCTSRTCSTQQSHAKDIQHLEAEAIEEEGKDCLIFLTTCCAALRASPP